MTLEFLLWKRHKNEECNQQLFQIYLNWCLIFQYPSLFTCLSTVKQGQVQPNTVHYRQVQPSTSPPPPSLVSFPDRSRNIRLGHYFANPWRVEVAKWETRNLPCRRIWNMSITNVYHACLAWFWHHIKWFLISFPFKAGSTLIEALIYILLIFILMLRWSTKLWKVLPLQQLPAARGSNTEIWIRVLGSEAQMVSNHVKHQDDEDRNWIKRTKIRISLQPSHIDTGNDQQGERHELNHDGYQFFLTCRCHQR